MRKGAVDLVRITRLTPIVSNRIYLPKNNFRFFLQDSAMNEKAVVVHVSSASLVFQKKCLQLRLFKHFSTQRSIATITDCFSSVDIAPVKCICDVELVSTQHDAIIFPLQTRSEHCSSLELRCTGGSFHGILWDISQHLKEQHLQ